MRVESVLDLIGGTPLVGLHQLSPKPTVKIYAKLEGENPTGSVKDRVAWSMVRSAEADGRLRPGATLVEPTSGNTGIALAMVAKLRGYALNAVMPDNVSEERSVLIRMFGAHVLFSPGAEGSNGAVRMAQRLAAEHPDWVFLNQYENMANVDAHFSGTGPEIWADCPEVTHFVAGLGTGGTLTGTGRFLKQQNPDVRVVAGEPPAGELVQGLRSLADGYTPPIFDQGVLDGKVVVRNMAAVEWSRRLLAECGIFAGLSSGAALYTAVKYAQRLDSATMVVLFPDGGWKYLSTGAWLDDLGTVEGTLSETSIW